MGHARLRQALCGIGRALLVVLLCLWTVCKALRQSLGNIVPHRRGSLTSGSYHLRPAAHVLCARVCSVGVPAAAFRSNRQPVLGWLFRRRRLTPTLLLQHSGVEMALGQYEQMSLAIRTCSSEKFEELVGELGFEDKAGVLRMSAELRQRLAEILTSKLSFWRVLPWRIMGVFGHVVGKEAEAKACAKGVLQEFAGLEASGKLSRSHRACSHIFEQGGALRQQLEEYACTNRPLQELPELFIELQEIALCPISERWVEGAHKETSFAFKHGEHHSPAGACAHLRRAQCLALADDPAARPWLLENWHAKGGLRAILTDIGLPRPASEAQLFEQVYAYSLVSMFQDVSELRPTVAAWRKEEHDNRFSGIVGTPWDISMVVDFLKERLPVGTVLSLPSALVPIAECNPCKDQAAIQRLDLVHGSCANAIELALCDVARVSEGGDLALEGEPVALAPPPNQAAASTGMPSDNEASDEEDTESWAREFVQVVQTYPEKRTMAQAGLVDIPRTAIYVVRITVAHDDGGRAWFDWSSAAATSPIMLDMRAVVAAKPGVMRTLRVLPLQAALMVWGVCVSVPNVRLRRASHPWSGSPLQQRCVRFECMCGAMSCSLVARP